MGIVGDKIYTHGDDAFIEYCAEGLTPEVAEQFVLPRNADFTPMAETAVFLRFDPIDTVLPASQVTSVVLTVALAPDVESQDDSGEVWQVACFTRSDLFSMVPAKQQLLAPSLGDVVIDTDAVWSLPTTSVVADQPTCLGIFSLTPDGTEFYNNNGPRSPRLTVTVE